jgi:ADP-ribosylation factor GTPase-activating protein 2/3
MGVHLTFVRSVDLDEWTQRQIDAMRLGGNGNARAFFRKHGFTDMYGGKTEKKYTSKAAVAYRAELARMVEAEAAKRGEGTVINIESTGSLLDNLELVEKKEQDELAKAKLAAARANSSAAVVQAKATKASSLTGASKLVITKPPAGGGSKVVLRKASSGSLSVSNILKKKPSNVGSKLRVNKIADAANGDAADDAFEDIETTQKAVVEAEKEAEQLAADEELARKLQAELNSGAPISLMSTNGTNGTKPSMTADASKPAETKEMKPLEKKMSGMEENMAKLKAMNSDFFSSM